MGLLQERVEVSTGLQVCESTKDLSAGTYRINIIKAGLTSCGTRTYPASVLEKAVKSGKYDGARMWPDHYTSEDTQRGARRVEAIAGTVVPGSVQFVNGTVTALAEVHKHSMREQLDTPLARQNIQVSHDACHTSKPPVGGVTEVTEITSVNSVDFVPTGNAGGRVLESRPIRSAEGNAGMSKTLEELSGELTALQGVVSGLPDAIAEQIKAAMPQDAPADPAEGGSAQEAATAKFGKIERELAEVKAASEHERQRSVVTEAVRGTELPGPSQARVIESVLRRDIPEGKLADVVTEKVKEEATYIEGIVRESGGGANVSGCGSSRSDLPTDDTEAAFITRSTEAGLSPERAKELAGAVPFSGAPTARKDGS